MELGNKIHSIVLLNKFCLYFYSYIICTLQLQKTSKQRNTVWRSDKIGDHNNRNKSIWIYIASQLPDAIQLPQEILTKPFITPRYQDVDQVLFNMMCNGSIGYLSKNTSHYYFCHYNNDKNIMKKKLLKYIWVWKVMDICILIP